MERIRAVRDKHYKLIRNFLPDRPYTQYNEYISTQYPTQRVIKEMGAAGKLNAVQAQWLASHKPEIELYDHEADPHEVHNLAHDPKHHGVRDRLSALLDSWIVDTNDQGRTLESEGTIKREEPRASARTTHSGR